MAVVHDISKGWLRMRLQQVAGNAVAVYPAFRKVLGLNAAAAQFLSQAVYWTERTEDGWFYKTESQWLEEIGLSAKEVRSARKALKDISLLEEVRKGVPAKMHYRVNVNLLFSYMDGSKGITSCAQKVELVVLEGGIQSSPNGTTITENTQRLRKEALSQGECEQDEQEQEADPRTPVEMTLNWKPDVRQLQVLAKCAMVDLERFTDSVIGSFVVHHSASGLLKTQGQWLAALVAWGKREKVSAEAAANRGPAIDETGVPVDQIIDLYHRACPDMPRVPVASDKALRGAIVERWNEAPEHQDGKGFWLPFFQKANSRNDVFFRGVRCRPHLEALVNRAVFREIEVSA